MSEDNYDVIISGCGPSGSLLGYLLAQNSVKTLIIEKEIFPRYKTCAGGIQHRALKLLPYDITPVIEKTINGIYFSFKNRGMLLKKHSDPVIYTVNRPGFDSFCAEKASGNGCDIKFGERVLGFEPLKNGINVFTDSNKYSARILAGADGIRGAVHRQVLNNSIINRIIGYEVEINTDTGTEAFDFTDNLLLDFGGIKRGYCWVFPKKNILSCGTGSPAVNLEETKKYFKEFLKKFYGKVNGSCRDFKSLRISAHGIPVIGKNTPFCSERVLNVGDAACLADGFTGEGLYNCFRSSLIACDSIMRALGLSDYSFRDYFEKINYEICSEIKTSLRLTKIFYGSINLFYKLITENDAVFSSCCKILRGEKSYGNALQKLNFLKF